jgi:hypothetical protein
MIRKRTILSLALLASTAACGGGGGGGSPAASGPAPAVSGGATPAQAAQTNFANPQVTSTADGTVTMSADQTSQTAVEDENRKVIIDVEAGGVSYHHTFDKADPTVYNANSVYQTGFAGETGFSEINNTDADGKHTLVFFNDGTRLSFANYGTWAHTDASGNVIAMGAYANGTPTPAADLQGLHGSATYTGNNTANGMMNDGSTYIGSPTITVGFDSKAVNGSIPYTNTLTGAAGPNVSFNATLNGANYAGAASATGMTGGVQGALVGPGAVETNGALGLSGGGKSFAGSFGASTTH